MFMIFNTAWSTKSRTNYVFENKNW